MVVPFLDLRSSYLELQSEIDDAVKRVLDSGHYILGNEVEQFEEEFAAYCGAPYCVGVANGLDALHLALLALGVGVGDEVIVPSNTYIATWLAVTQCGAVPVPVEPDPQTHNIDPALVEAAITAKTRVILPVHLYGQPADMERIFAIAEKHGLHVLEDGAQAHGSRINGARTGSRGHIVAWSFYPGKNLGALGDGGAITCHDPDIADRVRLLRNYGSRAKYVNEVCGYNSRLDPVQAAVLRVKLRVLDEWNVRRSQLASNYAARLSDTDMILPQVPVWAEPVWHLYVVRLAGRDRIQNELQKAGVNTLIHYPIPPHLQQAYLHLGYQLGDFPIAERLASEVLSLPMGPHLTGEQQDRVVNALVKLTT